MFLPVTNVVPETISPPVVPDSATLNHVRVLLVEDNADVATIATDFLEQCGCSIIRVGNAEAAIEILNRRNDIDIVFSDIVMPGMSGLELASLSATITPR